MMIRLQGLPEEIRKSIEEIKKRFDVMFVSREYKNRNSLDVRVYIEAELKK